MAISFPRPRTAERPIPLPVRGARTASVIELLGFYLGSRATFLGLIAFSFLWPRSGAPRIPVSGHPIEKAVPMPDLLVPFMNWDAGQFVRIAAHGYRAELVPYFPLYPLAIHVASLGNPVWMAVAAVLISLIATGLAVILLARLVQLDAPQAVWPAVTLLLLFPGAVFLLLPYSEALTLLFFVLAAYAARRQHWWLAGLAGAVAALTRPPGVAIVVLLVTEFALARHSRRLRDVPALALPLLALGGYLLYIWRAFGSPGVLFLQERSYGRHLGVLPVQFTSQSAHLLTSFNFWLLMGAVALALLTLRVVRPSYGLFALALVLGGFATGELESTVRFIGVAWPLFITTGIYLRDERIRLLVTTAFAAGLGYFAILFTHGYWVA